MKTIPLLISLVACCIPGTACVEESSRRTYSLSSTDSIRTYGQATPTPRPKKAPATATISGAR